ncbi:S-methyl-5-thioribose-1-phosphate isomerase [Synechococcus elongatus]|uniref:Methylthioribose-1-phosphate isomerase n=1 Tax=Synechococcus elongatus PCC 11801 TaxID=2219813 RepID=A0AAN1UVI1_SYNEL|nr:S-methyl-5-thioribose-1-phosphate isomerase [Synechococcus elongatus]AZB73676.1 S-methyl-5-thioribose-1-phosphate isomerase [Synechococcus elongatus PCC 11801]
MSPFQSIQWTGQQLRLLDQRSLPQETIYRFYDDAEGVAIAIRDMVVRGAPAIGVAAAFGLVLASQQSSTADADALRHQIAIAAETLKAARPTAVNLAWAVDRMLAAIADPSLDAAAIQATLLSAAQQLYNEDVAVNRQIGLNAQALIPQQANVIHHCNTGALATVDYGTALGIIRIAHEQGKQIHAYLDETRPRLQGANLSAYELQAYGVPHTVIVDGASGFLMRQRQIDCCLVGCDRVTANGDVANKIGTYNLALAAKAHGVPFYVACPVSTIDRSLATGAEIEIEERDGREITEIRGQAIAPAGTKTWNPAFDITPAELVTAIITERGILYPPYGSALEQVLTSPSIGAETVDRA